MSLQPSHEPARGRVRRTWQCTLALAALVAAMLSTSCLRPRIDISLIDKRTRLEEEILGTYRAIGRTVALSPTAQALGSQGSGKQDAAAPGRAAQHLRDALKDLPAQSLPAGESRAVCEARLRYNLFAALRGLGRLDEAKAELAKARAIANARRLHDLRWKIQYEQALLNTENRLDALKAAARAQYENLPLCLLSNEPLDRLMRKALLDRLVAELVADGELEEALSQVETFAALESCLFFGSAPQPPRPADAPAEYTKLAERRQTVVKLHAELMRFDERGDAKAGAEVARLQAALDAAIKHAAQAQGEIAYPRFEHLLNSYFNFEGTDASEVAYSGLLGRDGVYVRYYLSGRQLHIWQLSAAAEGEDEDAGGLRHTSLTVDHDFVQAAAALEANPLAWADAHVRLFSKTLIEPVSSAWVKAQVRRVYIAPGPRLLSVPWPALTYQNAAMCEKVQLAFATSALQLMMCAETPPFARRSVMFCPPGAGADALGDVLAAGFKETTTVTGEAATRAAVLAAARVHNVIQFGVPYHLSACRPWQSYVSFAGPESLRRTLLLDLASMDFKGQIIVLASPQSDGIGERMGESPLMRTADVLAAAGAPTVLAALAGTPAPGSALWERFYRELVKQPPGEAMRRAQAQASQSQGKHWALVRLFGHLGMTRDEADRFVKTAHQNIEAAAGQALKQEKWAEALRLAKRATQVIDIAEEILKDERARWEQTAAAAKAKAPGLKPADALGPKLVAAAKKQESEVGLWVADRLQEIRQAVQAAEQKQNWPRCVELAAAAIDLIDLLREGWTDKMLTWHRTAAQAAARASRFEEAVEHGHEWARLADHKGDKPELAKALFNLGVFYSNTQESHYDQAATHIQQALKGYERLGQPEQVIAKLINLADVHRKFQSFAECLKTLEQALKQAEKLGRPRLVAELHYKTGTVQLRHLNQYAQAEASYSKALAVARETGDEEMAIGAQLALGIARHRLGDFSKAGERITAALASARRIGHRKLQADAHFERANVAWFQGDYTQAMDEVQTALRLADTLRNEPLATCAWHTWTHLARAAAAAREGDYSKVESEVQRAWALGDKIPDPARFCVFNALGTALVANGVCLTGDYRPALTAVRSALAQDRKTALGHRSSLRMRALITLGLIYWTLNDYDKAMANLEQALELGKAVAARKELDVREDIASTLNNIGLVHRDQKHYPKAIATFSAALDTDRQLKSKWGQAYSHKNLGMTYRRMGQLARAQDHLAQSVALARSIGDKTSLVKALYSLGNVYADQGQAAEAKARYDEALKGSKDIGVREIEWRALWGLGRLARRGGDHEAAYARFEEAISVVERMRAAIRIEEYRNGFAANKLELYEDMVLLLLDEGKAEAAFHYSERARARSFIDMLGGKLASKATAEPITADRAAAILREAEGKPGADAGPSNVALVEYFVTKKEIIVWVLRGGQVHVARVTGEALRKKALERRRRGTSATGEAAAVDIESIDAASALSDAVLECRRLIQRIDDLEDYPRLLHDALIGPIRQYIQDPGGSPEKDCKYLCIVPHGVLHYLPFAALHDGRNYLVETHAIFYAPSASVLQFTMRPGGQARRVARKQLQVLAIGNPDLGSRSLELPFAENEVKSIRWNFALGNPGWATTRTAAPGKAPKATPGREPEWQFPNITVVTREQATEPWVRARLGQYDVIHIASHGEFDSANPLFSCLRLTADPSVQLDGRLDVRDVFAAKLKAELVILSACQSGLGKVEKGDEVIGLNRAFFYAGTQSIISSLWRVSDVTTGIMVKHFYRRYGGNNKADSLQQAQLQVKNDPTRREYRHPAYWAAFILVGEFR